MTVLYYTLRQSQCGVSPNEETFELRFHSDVGLTKYLRRLCYSCTGERTKCEVLWLFEQYILIKTRSEMALYIKAGEQRHCA